MKARSRQSGSSGPASFLLLLFLLPGSAAGTAGTGDPFAFFGPDIDLSSRDRAAIDRGEVVVRTIPGGDREVAVFAAVRLRAGGDTLVEAVRAIEELKRGPYVPAIGRFSDPPTIRDLESLSLDEADLEGIRRCRPGNCDLKLSGAEMKTLQLAAARTPDDWRPAVQRAFRSLVLERVRAYLRSGHRGMPRYEDDDEPVETARVFSALMRGSTPLVQRLPAFAAHLEHFPERNAPGVESFLYWSKEALGRKPVVMVTHVNILRPSGLEDAPDALVAGKQVFATHYTNGALALTSVLRGSDGSHYLAYLNRSQVDVLGGFLGWFKRALVESRIRSESEKIFVGLRERLERRAAARP